jgi:hypothetical protein
MSLDPISAAWNTVARTVDRARYLLGEAGLLPDTAAAAQAAR